MDWMTWVVEGPGSPQPRIVKGVPSRLQALPLARLVGQHEQR
jgi:hypothetical protein